MRIRSIWVAWGLLILGLLGNGAGLALSAANGDLSWHAGEALLWVVFPAFLVVGCLILARRPGNIIGWIFTAVGLLTTTATWPSHMPPTPMPTPGHCRFRCSPPG